MTLSSLAAPNISSYKKQTINVGSLANYDIIIVEQVINKNNCYYLHGSATDNNYLQWNINGKRVLG